MAVHLPDLTTAFYVLEWIIRLGALGVVPLRRSPTAASAWLLLIFFLPLPGLALFLAVGSPRYPRWRQQRFAELGPYFTAVARQIEPFAPPEDGQRAAAALARTLGGMPATAGNAIELIDGYDQVIERLVVDIEGARQYVHVLVYIFADDPVGTSVADALGRAVARGVECRVMFDPVGSHHWRRGTLRMLRAAGVEVREALPLHWLRGRTRRDMRNHRKLCVIDGTVGYAGSQNIVGKDFRPGVINRELVARVKGPVVSSLDAVVRGDWSLETSTPPTLPPQPRTAGTAMAQLLPSGADYPLEGFETLLVWQLHQAQRRAIIVTPYFIPDEAVLSAMRTAVRRGVAVDLIVSEVVDQWLVNAAQASYYEELLSAGVGVSMFRGYLLHAKNVSIDDRLAVLGSSNVDLRSFQLNQEVSLLLHDPATIASLKAIQDGYLEGSDRLVLETWLQRPTTRKLLENSARMISSLL